VSVVTPFLALVAVPIPLALLLPLVAVGIDWTDGRLVPLHDPTSEEASEPVVRPRPVAKGHDDGHDEEDEAPPGHAVVSEDSSERAFTWDEGGDEEEPEEDPGDRILGPDDDSSGLDGIAARIFDTF
jgi:hypothetical protein